MRVAYAVLKGGAGKTTSTMLTALAMARRWPRETVTVVDADPINDSASLWRRMAGEDWPENVVVVRWLPAQGIPLDDVIRQHIDPSSHLVVDIGPEGAEALAGAARVVDQIVVPIGATQLEAAAIRPTLRVIAPILQDERPDLDVFVLLTRVNKRSTMRQEAREAIDSLHLDILDTEVPNRVEYARAVGTNPRNLGAYTNVLSALVERKEA